MMRFLSDCNGSWTFIFAMFLLTACGYDVVDAGRFEVIPEGEFAYIDFCTDAEKKSLQKIVDSSSHLLKGSIANIKIDTSKNSTSFIQWGDSGNKLSIVGFFNFNSDNLDEDEAIFNMTSSGKSESMALYGYHVDGSLKSIFSGLQTLKLYAPHAGPFLTDYFSCPYQRKVTLKRIN